MLSYIYKLKIKTEKQNAKHEKQCKSGKSEIEKEFYQISLVFFVQNWLNIALQKIDKKM